jgi:tRNA(Ile)-lysidine synthase TilS/MesJ
MIKPFLKFQMKDIRNIAHRYKYPISETELMNLKSTVNRRGHLMKNELEKVTFWKAPRSAGHARKNEEDYVTEITRFTFATECEKSQGGKPYASGRCILAYGNCNPPSVSQRSVSDSRFQGTSVSIH